MKRTLHDNKGYFKMHWELLNGLELNWQEAFFLEYLIEVYPLLKEKVIIDGVEYRRLSDSFIQERIDVSKPTIINWLNDLEKYDYIKVKHIKHNKGARFVNLNVEIANYSEDCINDNINDSINECINDSINNRINDRIKNSYTKEPRETIELDEPKDICYSGSNEPPTAQPYQALNEIPNGVLKKSNDDSFKEKQQENRLDGPAAPAEPKKLRQTKYEKYANEVTEVINYLNEKANKHFKPTSKSHADLIIKWIKNDYTVDDLKKVIDYKCSAWLNDSYMNQYLQPSTLFGDKFEGYLENPQQTVANNGSKSYNNNTKSSTVQQNLTWDRRTDKEWEEFNKLPLWE